MKLEEAAREYNTDFLKAGERRKAQDERQEPDQEQDQCTDPEKKSLEER